MEDYVEVWVDGEKVQVERGIKVGELLKKLGVSYEGQLIVGLRAVREKLMQESTSYVFNTNRGSFVVEVREEVLEGWREITSLLSRSTVRWTSAKDVGIGPFFFSSKPRMASREWRPWDIIISVEGLELDNTHLVIMKSKHESPYALPEGFEVVGRVLRGRDVVAKLGVGDEVTSVQPLLTPSQVAGAAYRLSLEDVVAEPMEIYTRVMVKLLEEAPFGAEHFMAAVEGLGLTSSDSYSTFIRGDRLKGLPVPLENQARRVRGSVTVRVRGLNKGSIYVYKQARPSSSHHSVVGFVERGMELIDMAKPGDFIAVDTSPRRLSLLGLTQGEVSKLLAEVGVEHVRSGSTGDDDIVVEQNPKLTFQVLSQGRVETFGAPRSKVLKVKLYYEEAPRTVWYFKALTGLMYSRVGRLKVYFADPSIGFVLFEGNRELAGGLLPENNPQGKVAPFTIGVTNMSKRFVGLVGIRLSESNSYGPTGEDFRGTNMVGEVVGGLEAIKGVKDGSSVYVMEV